MLVNDEQCIAIDGSGSPVNPPIPNIGMNPSANNIGVLNRIDPPQRERNNVVKITTDGIEIIIVVVWKKAPIDVPIPVKYIWCAQTMKDMNPKNTIA